MYTFIDDHELFIMSPITGRIYRVGMDSKQDPVIVHTDTMSFESDIERNIIEKISKMVKD